MSETTDKVSLRPDILTVLGLDEESATRGNIAAHVYNVTQGGGMGGIHLGWSDQEASTDFLCSVVFSVEELWTEIVATYDYDQWTLTPPRTHDEIWNDLRDNGRDHEVADSCVPIYTHSLLKTAIELGATDLADSELRVTATSMTEIAQTLLYELALSIVDSMIDKLIEGAK